MKSKIKGLTMLVFIGIILVVATLVPSVSAQESKAYSRYKLVDSWVSWFIRYFPFSCTSGYSCFMDVSNESSSI